MWSASDEADVELIKGLPLSYRGRGYGHPSCICIMDLRLFQSRPAPVQARVGRIVGNSVRPIPKPTITKSLTKSEETAAKPETKTGPHNMTEIAVFESLIKSDLSSKCSSIMEVNGEMIAAPFSMCSFTKALWPC